MKSNDSIFENLVAREILDYLMRNPQAEDTIEGIARWWLMEQTIRNSIAEVKAVLDEAVAQSLILSHQGADGRIHYRVNPEKEGTIRQNIRSRNGKKNSKGNR